MIDQDFLKQLATKNQNIFKNTLREYLQNLFLNYFYQEKQSEKFFFKGGTALRIVFRSPRFSEDLGYDSTNGFNLFENILAEVLEKIEKENIKTEIIESKTTTGGFFSNVKTALFAEEVEVKIQVSKRKSQAIKGERIVIVSDFAPSYPIQILAKELLFSEKIEAFLTRAKTRDFFDLYFILRSETKPPIIFRKKNEIIKIIKTHSGNFSELKTYLPRNFWPVIKDLKNNLLSQL